MWPNIGKVLEIVLTDLEPTRVLYEFDGPQIFICNDALGDPLLAYHCDDTPGSSRFLLVPFSKQLEEQLTAGIITMREALDQPRAWMVIANDWIVSEVRRITIDEVPSDNLPRPGAVLWPQLQPLFSIRAVGEQIKRGDIRGSVVQDTAKRAEDALQTLTKHVAGRLGIAAKKAQRLWDLPAQRFAFNSFQISFRSPTPEEIEAAGLTSEEAASVYSKVAELLRAGISIADEAEGPDGETNEDVDERRAMLEAAKALSPKGSGEIQNIELFGKLVGRPETKSATLGKRTHTAAVREITKLKDRAKPDPRVQVQGWVYQVTDKTPTGEAKSNEFVLIKGDASKVTFTLDDKNESLWSDVTQAIESHAQVIVSGMRHPKLVKIVATSVLPAPPLSESEDTIPS